tara:strand:- start:7 stop:759 length:753 start_codon:yes stop_codon:yes gene_type:complete
MSERKYRVEKINYEVLNPFGPSIMTGTIPENIYVQFKDIIEGIVKEKKESHAEKLAGRIEDEWTIGEEYLWQTQVEEFLVSLAQQYGEEVIERYYSNQFHLDSPTDYHKKSKETTQVGCTIVGGWVNEMKSFEYNPLHYHPFCNVTSVFYFSNIDDEFIKEIIAPSNKNPAGAPVDNGTSGDGFLELVYKSTGYFEQGTLRVSPREGMFLLFPSSLLHTVYPFISNKKRLSASFNFILQSNHGVVNFGER